jgi:hypothetical protein
LDVNPKIGAIRQAVSIRHPDKNRTPGNSVLESAGDFDT